MKNRKYIKTFENHTSEFNLSDNDKYFLKNREIKEVHIDEIKAGDTILHDNEIRTVGKNNIKKDKFMGTSLFGDSYKYGHKLVKKVII